MLNSFLAQYADQMPTLEAHIDLLLRWNKTVNLTAITDRDEAMKRHIAESLFLAANLPSGRLKICDLGSGGGFPGVPVAIARTDCEVVLVESDVRKGVFLREATRSLTNVKVVTARFETVNDDFDWLISRAVNLSKTVGGPMARNAAFLGELDPNPSKRSQAARFQWHPVPFPWDTERRLSIGECFT